MCPACLSTAAAAIATGVVSSGGLVAIMLASLGRKPVAQSQGDDHGTAENRNYLDFAPKGRDEEGLAFTMAWLRHHDRYDENYVLDPTRSLRRAGASEARRKGCDLGLLRVALATGHNGVSRDTVVMLRVLSADSPTRPRRQKQCRRERRLRGGRGGPVRGHPQH